MTVAYLVQVNTPKGIQYLTTNSKLDTVPKFFRSIPTVRAYLKSSNSTPAYYDSKTLKALTSIIVVKDLDKGIKGSIADVLTYDQFMDLGKVVTPKMISNQRAFYKVKLANGTIEGARTGGANKFGKMWSSAGHLRAHLTARSRFYTHLGNNPSYKDAKIIEVQMKADNVNVDSMREYPIIDWYSASPTSRQHLAKKPVNYRAYASA